MTRSRKPSRTSGRSILVLGAGLAGLAATERLLDASMNVTVVDSFPLPGGRTASFDVPVEVAGLMPGDVVEHGLHAWFQHYHALYALMDRAAVPKPPFAGDGVYLWNPEFGHVAIEGRPFFWLLSSLGLPEAMRGRTSAALGALFALTRDLHADLTRPEQTDRESAFERLTRAGVPAAALDGVFRPCLYSLTSLPLEELSALEMLRWMSSILPDPRIRVVEGGGTQAMCAPIARALVARGADVRYGVEVRRLTLDAAGRAHIELASAPDRTGVRHILVPGFEPATPPDPGTYDAVVCTLPWERVLALSARDPVVFAPNVWRGLRALGNVHPLTLRLWFARPIEGAHERYILSSGTVFDVLRPTPEPHRHAGVRLIDALVENIDTHLPELGYDEERFLEPSATRDRVVRRVLADLERLYPGQIQSNELLRCFVHTREGIVACRPGTTASRAPQYIGSPHFVFGGDWTQHPYGVCMEGAVRSGQLAAEALLSGAAVHPKPLAFEQLAFSARSLFHRS